MDEGPSLEIQNKGQAAMPAPLEQNALFRDSLSQRLQPPPVLQSSQPTSPLQHPQQPGQRPLFHSWTLPLTDSQQRQQPSSFNLLGQLQVGQEDYLGTQSSGYHQQQREQQ